MIIGTTLIFGGDFTSVISPDGTTSVPRPHLAAVDLTTGALLPWNPTTNGGVDAMATDGTTVDAESDMIPLTFGGHTFAYHFVRVSR